VGTPIRKNHDSIVNKKRKKKCDENLDVAAKLATYICYPKKQDNLNTKYPYKRLTEAEINGWPK
jgi:hypothetical protein